MKKVFLLLLSVIALNVYALADKPVTFAQLPQKAQQFINKHFGDVGFLSAKQDDGEYEVMLKDGTKIDFTLQGDWKKVDCEGRPVPVGYFPESISAYVVTNYSGAYIEEIQFEHNRYEVGLEGLGYADVDLLFDKEGQFIGLDD